LTTFDGTGIIDSRLTIILMTISLI
jgi:hypothetical protein